MRKHRFYIDHEVSLNSAVTLDEEVSHYISRVLRLKLGDQIYLFNNSGSEFIANITDINKRTVITNVTDAIVDTNESPLQIHLAQVLGKGDKMDLVIQKATELGVTSITPLYSEHTVVKNVADRSAHKLEHWQKIAIAASCQAGRNFVPNINTPAMLKNWLQECTSSTKLILHPDQSAQHLKEINFSTDITILIGPEGGFSNNELQQAQQHNFININLGPRILRTETAGLATIAVLQALAGDL